jgi:hypothetical protein
MSLLIVGEIAVAQEPTRLQASIDNWGGRSYSVQLSNGKVLYSERSGADSPQITTVTPSIEQWRAFRRALDTIPVWSWHAEYITDVFDGTGWSLSVKYSDRSLVSEGGNCYPRANGEKGPDLLRTAAFQQLESAIEALVGGKTFRSEQDVEKK